MALKDNVCLAGVPMMNGASTLKGYTPDIDATLVTRLLDAGATIVGKAHCEYFCLSGGSHTNATGPVHNPHKHGYSAGGSSSGSGALVGTGEVDMAIGGDQGGSIRMPASFCGVYGMKPTHGLVPYTGVMPIETTIDHVGPDDRERHGQRADARGHRRRRRARPAPVRRGDGPLHRRTSAAACRACASASSRKASASRAREADVDAEGARGGRDASAGSAHRSTRSRSPGTSHGPAIWTPIALEGLQNQMMHGNGMGTGWKGLYTTSPARLPLQLARRARTSCRDTLKISMLVGQYHLKHTRGHYYAKAQNLARQLQGRVRQGASPPTTCC